jgi:hypothetical protein
MEHNITTESGSKYCLRKSNGLWLIKENYPIVWLGKERKIVGGLVGMVAIEANEGKSHFVRVQEKDINDSLETEECIGQQIFYAHPNSYETIIRLKNKINQPKIYDNIEKYLGITTKIKDIR